MIARVSMGLRVVAGPKQIERHCDAVRVALSYKRYGDWTHGEPDEHKRAARIVKRGLG